MGNYNRHAAVRYAIMWAKAKSRNPAYKNYSKRGGGDCTNFVSQCLAAGGWQMIPGRIPGGKHDGEAWYCNDSEGDNSNTWSSAQWFYNFLDGSPRVTKCDEDDLWPGDIVMLQAPDFSSPDHAMIVTYITELSTFEGEEKQICLSYHDDDQLHNPLDEIKSRYSKKTKYFYFHVNDIFKDYDPSQEVEPGWGT